MDHYMDANKDRVKLSLQNEVNQTQTILGEAFYKKCLWKGEQDSYVEKVVVKNGNVFYQMKGKTDILKVNDHGPSITPAEFYEPFLHTIQLSYPQPQFLTLGETVVKTEKPYKRFMVAEHFTKKIYFIAPADYMEGGSLYAADIGKGAKEVVAEKVEIGAVGGKLTALAVNQFSGDIVLARYGTVGYGTSNYKIIIHIQSWQKLAYLSEMLTFAGISSSIKNVKNL